jgi:hypothetical protein
VTESVVCLQLPLVADESEWFLKEVREFRNDLGLTCATEKVMID